MAGIVGYGAFIPRNRITSEEIARQWGKDPAAIQRGLLLKEKSVPGLDEDTITISVAAGRAALERSGVAPQRVGALYIGSESHPYAVKPSGTVVIEALGIGPSVHVADFEFACKAGSEAMFVALGLVESGRVEYAMGIGADTSQGAPNDALEFSASAGGAAYLFGKADLLADRKDPAFLDAVQLSARRAYESAGIGPADVHVVEVHDCFTIAEICCIEALGLVGPGKGRDAARSGLTALGGKVPVNTSGGLKSTGTRSAPRASPR